jgi:uncharacterized coiled-coil DUF342 family protein
MVEKMNSFHDSTSTSFSKQEWESQASSFASEISKLAMQADDHHKQMHALI